MQSTRRAIELQHHVEALLREFPELSEDEELKLDTLEGIDFDTVLGQVVERSLGAKSVASAIDLRRKALDERKSRFLAQHQFFRALAMRIMQAAELQKYTLPEATLSVTKGRLGVRINVHEDQLPTKFQRIKVEADKKALLNALKAGESVDGAALSNGPPTLTIRTK